MSRHPDIAPARLTLGVTGHRILTELDRITAGVDEALARIEQVFPARSLTVLSALAEGTDRLVVQRILRRPDTRLLVPLPLTKADYMADFASAESKQDFLSLLGQADEVVELAPTRTREQAYENAGLYILDHCNVLLAIWDGQGAQGQGGTGGVVARARERGLPIAWIHAGNRKPGTLEPTSFGAKQGMVTFERL
jgi:hypothetical protein